MNVTGLGNFLPEEQDLLIGIFYRVGFWISHIDDTDVSEESERIEQQRLVQALKKISQATGSTELVKELAAEALRRSGDQKRWLANEDRLLADVNQASTLVRGQGTVEDYQSYGKSVMFAATSVARAFREDAEHGEQAGKLGKLLDRASALLGAGGGVDAYQDLNISPAEDTALHELSSALTVR